MALFGVPSDTLESFARHLVTEGHLSNDQLALAQVSSKNLGLDLGEVLIRKGLFSSDQLLQDLGVYLQAPWESLTEIDIDPELLNKLPLSLAQRFRCLPLSDVGESFKIAMADPSDDFAKQELERLLGRPIQPVLSSMVDLESSWKHHYQNKSVRTNLEHKDHSSQQNEISYEENSLGRSEELKKMASGKIIIDTLNNILGKAYALNASDIHIEPEQENVRVRLRIDGLLQEQPSFPKNLLLPFVSRVKILSGLDIAERRVPQDGRIHVRVVGKPLDLRISTFPTLYGEKIVMRLMAQEKSFRIESIGFNDKERRTFSKIIAKSFGLFLVTGPTGSGKSTTLYAALSQLNEPSKNIISIEDPIENQLVGINQCQVNPKSGLTFASALKAVLRQDPDVIMLGEIRDRETAEIAIRAAITGHLVLSTLHTNTAAGALTRLTDLGIEPFLVASSVQGVLAQRLVRRNCSECLAPVPEGERADPNIPEQKSTGCKACGFTGIRGRMGLFELASISEECRNLICKGANEEDIAALWKTENIRPLYEDGLIKVGQGKTTMQEVIRVSS